MESIFLQFLQGPTLIWQAYNTVKQLNLTAVKISILDIRTYLVQENLAFGKEAKIKKSFFKHFSILSQE